MADTAKMKFTFLDDDGKPIQPKAEEQQEESQEEENIEEQEDQSDEESTEESSEETTEESEQTSETISTDETEEEQEAEADEDEEDDSEEERDTEDDDSEIIDFEELPEAVQTLMDFLQDNPGSSVQDFVEVNKDFSKIPEEQMIARFIKEQNPHLDDDDIKFEMEERFRVDPDEDDERTQRRKKVEKKKMYGQAVQHFEQLQGKYKADLASGNAKLPKEVQQAVQFKQTYDAQQAQEDKRYESNRKTFLKQTDRLFGKDFKGFEVKVGDETLTYKPSDARKLKEQNLDVNNIIDRFVDPKTGVIKDVSAYHRAMAFATDPDGVAEHFISIGRAQALEEDAKDSKNIKDSASKQTRKTQSARKSTGTPKFRFLDDSSQSNNSKIKLRNY